jgi:hypothetical protein
MACVVTGAGAELTILRLAVARMTIVYWQNQGYSEKANTLAGVALAMFIMRQYKFLVALLLLSGCSAHLPAMPDISSTAAVDCVINAQAAYVIRLETCDDPDLFIGEMDECIKDCKQILNEQYMLCDKEPTS